MSQKHTHTYMYVCMHVCMYACMHVCIYAYMYTYTYIYIYIYIYIDVYLIPLLSPRPPLRLLRRRCFALWRAGSSPLGPNLHTVSGTTHAPHWYLAIGGTHISHAVRASARALSCIHIHMHTYIYIYIYIYICIYMCIYIYIHTYIHINDLGLPACVARGTRAADAWIMGRLLTSSPRAGQR